MEERRSQGRHAETAAVTGDRAVCDWTRYGGGNGLLGFVILNSYQLATSLGSMLAAAVLLEISAI